MRLNPLRRNSTYFFLTCLLTLGTIFPQERGSDKAYQKEKEAFLKQFRNKQESEVEKVEVESHAVREQETSGPSYDQMMDSSLITEMFQKFKSLGLPEETLESAKKMVLESQEGTSPKQQISQKQLQKVLLRALRSSGGMVQEKDLEEAMNVIDPEKDGEGLNDVLKQRMGTEYVQETEGKGKDQGQSDNKTHSQSWEQKNRMNIFTMSTQVLRNMSEEKLQKMIMGKDQKSKRPSFLASFPKLSLFLARYIKHPGSLEGLIQIVKQKEKLLILLVINLFLFVFNFALKRYLDRRNTGGMITWLMRFLGMTTLRIGSLFFIFNAELRPLVEVGKQTFL